MPQTRDTVLSASTLPTEAPHPYTSELSQWAQDDPLRAFEALWGCDAAVVAVVAQQRKQILALRRAIKETVASGHRVYILGCGASGRLALLLEKRMCECGQTQVVGCIGGGDVAVLQSVEAIEDDATRAPQQLKAQGFTEKDLLIALSASGRSPFTLAAYHWAQGHSQRPPWWLMCNALSDLQVLAPGLFANANDRVLALPTGPMALTGSTRLAATTAMQVTLTLALTDVDMAASLSQLAVAYQTPASANLCSILNWEIKQYQAKQEVVYQSDAQSALLVLSDVTERTPTFNVPTLPHANQVSEPWLRLTMGEFYGDDAWATCLGHAPRCLNWPDIPVTADQYWLGYAIDIGFEQSALKFTMDAHCWHWQCDDAVLSWHWDPSWDLWRDILCKGLLNAYSTTLYGAMGYYKGNQMRTLRPSCEKLVERTLEQAKATLTEMGYQSIDHTQLADRLTQIAPGLKPHQSIVALLVEDWQAQHAK